MMLYRDGQTPRLIYAAKQDYGTIRFARPIHQHSCVELMYVTIGLGEYTINDQIYEIEPGDILLYNQGDFHEIATTTGCQIGAYAFGMFHLSLEGLPDNSMCSPSECFVRPVTERRQEISSLCKLLYELSGLDDPHSRAVAQSLLTALVLLAVNLPADERANTPSSAATLAALVRKYIGIHFCEPITLRDISAAVGASPYYISHVFKQIYKISPLQYVIRCRIGEAQNLLISEKFSVSQIAAMVGYPNASYFNSIFKKNVGISPMRYQKWFFDNLHGKKIQ